MYNAVRKVRGETPKHTKYGTFEDASTLESLITLYSLGFKKSDAILDSIY